MHVQLGLGSVELKSLHFGKKNPNKKPPVFCTGLRPERESSSHASVLWESNSLCLCICELGNTMLYLTASYSSKLAEAYSKSFFLFFQNARL